MIRFEVNVEASPGTEIVVTCSEGQEFDGYPGIGMMTSVCSPPGKWNPDIPNCIGRLQNSTYLNNYQILRYIIIEINSFAPQ